MLYAQRLQRTAEQCLTEQVNDIRLAAATLCQWYPGMRVEGYLAMRRQRTLSFHDLGIGGTTSLQYRR